MASTASSPAPAPKGKSHAEYTAEIQHLKEEGGKIFEERERLAQELREKDTILLKLLDSRNTFKMKMPDAFTGNDGNLQEFLTSARAYISFNQKSFATEESKVLFVGSLFKGTALSWFEPYMRDYLKYPLGKREKETNEIFEDYDTFEEKLKIVFGWPDEERINERKLRALRQQGSAAEYTAKFRQISSKLEWADEPLMAQYYEGLKDEVKDELIRNERPDDLSMYIEQAVRMDNRLHERRLERRGHQDRWTPKRHQANTRRTRVTYDNHYAPMELDAVKRNPQQRKNKDKKDITCYNCGKIGHYKSECRQTGGNQRQEPPRRDWKPVPQTQRNVNVLQRIHEECDDP